MRTESPWMRRGDGQRVRQASLAAVLLLAATGALACGERIATRGGQMNDDQGEMNFELVHRARQVIFHLEDHGTPVTTRGATANLELKRGASGWSAKLRPEGVNTFVASLPEALRMGDSVAVSVSFPNGSIANGHFSVGQAPKPRRPSFAFAQPIGRP